MRKKALKIAFAIVVVIFTTVGFKIADENNPSAVNLIFANIEAFGSDAEGVKTTWNCVGNVGKCYAQCPACGTVVRGSGDLLGMHECN